MGEPPGAPGSAFRADLTMMDRTTVEAVKEAIRKEAGARKEAG